MWKYIIGAGAVLEAIFGSGEVQTAFLPLAMLLPAAITGVTSLINGVQQSRAAGKAGDQQSAASDAAAQKIGQATDTAAAGVTQAGQDAVGRIDTATGQANQTLGDVFGQITGAINPYQQAGTQALSSLSALGDEKFQFTQDDPSYQFRLQEGQKALERSAAARGGLQSGGTLKALTRYAQGVASTEYQSAFDRFIADRQSRSNTLSTLAGLGSNANSQLLAAGTNYGNNVSNNLTRGAEYGGNALLNSAATAGGFQMDGSRSLADLITGKGNAQAAATLNKANAWSGAVNGLGNAAADIADVWAKNRKPKPMEGV